MKRQALVITLKEDCVFSARSATEGGHESLDFIPGQALLGAAASSLYSRDLRQAYEAFHSGRLRFSDGLPFDGNSVAFPVPFSWYRPKSEKAVSNGYLVADKIHNCLHENKGVTTGQQEQQQKQLRRGYVYPDGRIVEPEQSMRFKTAIQPGTGRAAEGQLFGYESLNAGQCFASFIEADDDFDDGLFTQVIDALQGERLLGRSRSAEYGRVTVETINLAPPVAGAENDRQLSLWLLSDLALVDGEGRPTLELKPAFLGLNSGTVVWEKTFLRSRSYSPWNGARHGYDRQRMVFCAGGVITLDLNEPPTALTLDRLMSGVGIYREAGLGRLWCNPPLLANASPKFETRREHVSVNNDATQLRSDHPLIGWLENRRDGREMAIDADQQAANLAKDYQQQVEAGRRLLGIPEDVDFGPSKSQWGRVLEAARQYTGKELFAILFEGASAIAKPDGSGWDIEVPSNGSEYQPIAKWLKDQLRDTEPPQGYAYWVRQLAYRVREKMENRGSEK